MYIYLCSGLILNEINNRILNQVLCHEKRLVWRKKTVPHWNVWARWPSWGYTTNHHSHATTTVIRTFQNWLKKLSVDLSLFKPLGHVLICKAEIQPLKIINFTIILTTGWAYSMELEPASVCPSTLSNMNISETSWSIIIKFHQEHLWGGGLTA